MLFLTFLLSLSLAVGCSETLEPPHQDSQEVGPSQEHPTGPQEEDYELLEIVERATDTRNEIDALRCFLLHEAEIKKGKAPDGWVLPSLDVYENTLEPCELLPRFIDPKESERIELEAEKEQIKNSHEDPIPAESLPLGRLTYGSRE